ncbi:E3 ubiquitin-protein ligase Ubr3 isoform X1 [Helicoverpa zea]|uniref:E3 ubiquitin-protein ligase Ubr3 isoform X1 n=1 Tax=Helicoverpa zea TaxID=7113 RepID=UPI001F585373|nr:E3 ubiquitin-protein ligase Ubr3 isoform X1 [Helicoverpa zea]XP_047030368.1 E3 ubiquitin-protein ligase Ubr3 isoform X1 [Helicoverpa zea]
MSNSTAQVLMKKGKRGAAAYIHADCENGSPQHLGPLLDVLLNPSKAIDEWETIDWCRWLLAGGRTPDEFATIVRSYDKHDKCGLVWIPRVVAYRCRTCGISPCMSICRECFHRGDHSTHDFNMFLSQAGGACDCGDKSVMKEDGFCSNHGNKCPRPGDVPAALMCVAEAMMPRLILRLLQHFRENSCGTQTTSDTYRITVQECEGYVKMLMEFNNMGDLMRSAMTKALINPQMYRNLVEPPFPDTEYGCYMAESNKMYEKALEMFPAPEPPDEYRHLPALAPRLQHNTLLDEFIFWTFKYEFPQNVVCFLLNMLPDQDYKEHLTRTFVMHYARIPLVLEDAADPDTLSNRVVHMSVQLFSNEALALRCVQQLHLLHVMVLSLRLMMGKILVQNTLHDPDQNFHYVIDCTRRVMKEHCYWPLVSDFNNVLSHKSVALLFLQDDALVDMWFEFLSMLQGMNVNIREVGGHIEFEPSSYYAAFSCELEAAAYPMWSVLSHLTDASHAPLARRIIAAALTYLQEWLDAVHFTTPHMERSEVMHASFHFPLHRYLAAFLCAGVRGMGLRAADVLPPPDLLALLAVHPLRVQSLFYEILAGVWVRNGLQIKGQAMTYIQANFCNSMVDMDIYWLQVCAAHLPADQFLDMCIDMFGCREWLSMMPMSPAQAAEQDAMVEGLLTFLAILVSSRTNLGNDELTQSRLEVSTLLAAGDKTHSQLLELMPERSGNAHTRNFETVLKELSTYRPPPKGSENLEQGLFVPKPIVWEQYYDPLHVLRRAVHRRDFHASMERYSTYVREKQKAEGSSEPSKTGSGVLWPPLRPASAPPGGAGDPRVICASGVLHGALLGVLHRGVHRRAPDAPAPHAPPDHVLALAVCLLHVAADLHAERQQQHHHDVMVAGSAGGGSVSGVPLLGAFAGAAVCDNARTVVASVPAARAPPAPPAASPAQYTHQHHSDSDTEWEPSENETTRIPLLTTSTSIPATSTALAVPTSLQVARGDSMTDDQSDGGGDAPQIRALEDVTDDSQALALQSFDHEMSLAIATSSDLDTPPVPIEYDMDEGSWSVSVRGAAPALPAPRPAHAPPAIQDAPRHPEPAQPSTSNQVQLHTQSEDSIPVNESIISLLLKLHSQLSGRLDSFSLDEPAPETEEPIGDGPYFIGRVLRKLAALDARCAAAIAHVRHSLWPHQRERQAEQRARERREKEERSRRARERQQQLMREFARRQQQFISAMQNMDGEVAAAMDWEEEEAVERDYDCVICNTTAPTTPNDPIGLVVLLQSTSVLGHRRRAGGDSARLALSEAERARLQRQHDGTAAAHHYRLHDEMHQHFDLESWLVSVSVGWEGGVHVQSCGHHLHLRCLHAYLRALQAPQRPHNLHVERGEFLCPVCRQLANCVLPLAPPPPAPRPAPRQHQHSARILQDMLEKDHPPPAPSRLSEAMGKAMEDMTATAGGKLKQRYGSSPAAIFTFVASLVRTNLECELVQRGGTLQTCVAPRYKLRNECIVPLLVVAGAHSRVLSGAGGGFGAAAAWRALCPPAAAPAAHEHAAPVPSAAASARPVPLLLKDPTALLMQFLLLAPPTPPYLDMQEFTCIVRALYSLSYYQVVCQFIANCSASGRAALAAAGRPGEPAGLRAAAKLLLGALAGSDLFTEDGPPAAGQDPRLPDLATMEKQLQELLLPFLRIAALLRHHLYGSELPEVATPRQEFVRLAYYLELVTDGMEWSEWSAGRALPPDSAVAARAWARQLGSAAARGQLAVRRLLRSMAVEWCQPALLALPRDYDRLFTYYHERVCLQCGAVPKEASVCLLCGTLVCLKQPCCRQHQVAEAVQVITYSKEASVCLLCGTLVCLKQPCCRQHQVAEAVQVITYSKEASVCLFCGTLVCLKQPCCRQHQVAEAVQHAMECGGGTGIFLVVTSTYIIVIRGRRACLWGSLYLDDYDEEDRDLKRGKPLYLSQDRLELLQAQWLAHRFDHTKRTWVWHRDSL